MGKLGFNWFGVDTVFETNKGLPAWVSFITFCPLQLKFDSVTIILNNKYRVYV